MKNVKELTTKALFYFRTGYNCTESVILTIAKDTYEIDSDLIPKIATGFGGGIGRQGYVCGAVIGAIMGFGLKYGRNSPKELKAKTYNASAELCKQFKERFGTVFCKELCGCDLSTIEGVKKFGEENIREEKCSKFVSDVIEIFMVLQDQQK